MLGVWGGVFPAAEDRGFDRGCVLTDVEEERCNKAYSSYMNSTRTCYHALRGVMNGRFAIWRRRRDASLHQHVEYGHVT